MRLNLETKYSLIILLLIILVAVTLIGIFYIHAKNTLQRITDKASQSMSENLHDQLKSRAGLFIQVLSKNLVNPLYQYDMETLYDIAMAAKEQKDIVYVYVYEPSGKIIEDGTEGHLHLNKILDDEVSRNAVAAKNLLIQTKEEILDAAIPIKLHDELLGGVRVGFSLKGIKDDIANIKYKFKDLGKEGALQIIWDVVIIAASVTILSIIAVIFISKGLAYPITLLSRLTTRIGRGEYDVDIPIRRSDEIGTLADSFKKMAMNLKETTVSRDELAKEVVERKKAEEKLKKAYDDLKDAQAKLVQSEKLASIGKMATGVAHEINNPLTAISGEAEILLKDKNKDKETKESSKIIVEQAERIKTITENLLEFSRKKELRLVQVYINNILEESIHSLGYQVKMDNIIIEKDLDAELPKILGDKTQLEEVFLNIMLNAVQAMEEKGTLSIRTYKEKIKSYGRRKTDIFKLGQEVLVIEFKDTGIGMADETLSKIFDPFFTTKEINTGLGLSISFGIIQSHNGTIEAQSRLGEGSVFIIKLPV